MTETEAIRENYNLGVLTGEAREQQRIIKLLEDFNEYNPTCQCCYTELCINDVIALIKGENNE